MKRNALMVGVLVVLVASFVVADETEKIGQVRFPVSCAPAVQKPFERAVALLHSFWYLEAAKAFTQIAQADPACAMAYWGLALTNWTQIWSPPSPAALKRGGDAVDKAKAAGAKTPRERDFIAAAEAFFKDADTVDEARAIVADMIARVYDSGRPTAHFAMAAIEARWAMERGKWAEAAAIEPRPNRFPHTEPMIYFARAIGAARTGNAVRARADADTLAALKDAMRDPYWAEQIEIQQRAAAAWTARAEGKAWEGFALMRSAVELEASTEKHNITPGPIATAGELLGDMLMEAGLPGAAVEAYVASLGVAPNRFKALYGVAKASERAGDRAKAKAYYAKLLATAAAADTTRPELQEAKAFK